MFKVFLLSAAGDRVRQIPKAVVKKFSIKFGGGRGVFVVPRSAGEFFEKKTLFEFQKWDGTKFLPVYSGSLEATIETNQFFQFGLEPPESILKNRYTNPSQIFSGEVGTLAENFLAQINADAPTGISFGSQNISTEIEVSESEMPADHTFDDFANQCGGEWKIDAERKLHFLDRLGTDKTSSVFIRHKKSEPNRNSIEDLTIQGDSSDLANRIIALSHDGLGNEIRVVVEDAESIAKYGLFIDKIRINSAKTIETLTTMATEILDQRKEELLDIEIVPRESKIVSTKGGDRKIGFDFFDFELGDDISLDLETDSVVFSGTKRVLEKNFEQVQNGIEKISLTLSRAGAKKTAIAAVNDWEQRQEIFKRLREIESLL